MQVVYGLLCDFQGIPVSIQAFLKQDVVQRELFDETVSEVIAKEGLRYVLRRNPTRAAEMAATRASKFAKLQKLVNEQNTYLAEHPRASVQVAQRNVDQKCKKLRLPPVQVMVDSRTLSLSKDGEQWNEAAQLDGCYCLKTDLSKTQATKEIVHQRYKDLSQVEWSFRTSKTVHLEARPVYVRLESRTRGHLFVVMLAYLLVQELAKCWRELDMTVEEGIDELKTLCTTQVSVQGKVLLHNVPDPRPSVQRLLDAAQVKLPSKIPSRGVTVSTRKKLVEERKTA